MITCQLPANLNLVSNLTIVTTDHKHNIFAIIYRFIVIYLYVYWRQLSLTLLEFRFITSARPGKWLSSAIVRIRATRVDLSFASAVPLWLHRPIPMTELPLALVGYRVLGVTPRGRPFHVNIRFTSSHSHPNPYLI